MTLARMLPWLWLLGLAACAAAPETGGSPPAGAAPPQPPTLAGTRWIGVVGASTDAQLAPRMEFVRDRMSGFTGCNMMSGSWRMEAGEVRLGPVVTTRRMCLGEAGDIEKRLLAALGEGSRLRREGARLVLVGAAGARFEFTQAE